MKDNNKSIRLGLKIQNGYIRFSTTNDPLMLRKANIEDLMFIYNLRNDPLVVESSFTSERITLETHTRWFNDKINSINCSILIAEYNNRRIGQIRFDLNKKRENAEVSIAILPEYRQKGLAVKVLKLGCLYAAKMLSIKNCLAFIKIENEISVKTFSKAGFLMKGNSVKKGHNSIEMNLEFVNNSEI
jgi:RimJ/RimL family protein N-acetyltransferase